MENQRTPAERIRPILQAMERSIDAARRSRVKDPIVSPPRLQPVSPATFPAPPANGPVRGPAADEAPARLKAKPKRLESPYVNNFQPPAYRSQTG